MNILSIETSCDETAISLVKADGDQSAPVFKVLGNALYSQIDKHKEFGGVYPSLAKREHALNLVPLLDDLLKQTNEKVSEKNSIDDKTAEQLKEIFSREPELFDAFIELIPNIKKPNIDLITVTSGPGLEPALWVGINFARALSLFWQIPLLPVNHMEGHITSVLKESSETDNTNVSSKIEFPAVALLISGGHTELVLIKNWGEYEIIGKTKDDAVGEAFDKVARLLDLEYPGGPKISALAKKARDKADPQKDAMVGNDIKKNVGGNNPEIKLPRPMINSDDFDFSFSGIKTAVLYLVKKLQEQAENTNTETGKLKTEIKEQVALEFENAVTEVLYKKTTKALDKHNANTLIIGGGVIANTYIRETFKELEGKDTTKVLIPEFDLTTDNAVMIAIAGYLKSFNSKPEINPEIIANGNLSLN
jgi:N6-L-threonylcarbamoyladenine synthase